MTTVAISQATKRRLGRIKPQGVTYDQAVGQLLDARPESEWRDELHEAADRPVRVARARRARMLGARSVTRHPSEQRQLAQVAAESWDLWLESRRVMPLGPRRFRLNPPPQNRRMHGRARRV